MSEQRRVELIAGVDNRTAFDASSNCAIGLGQVPTVCEPAGPDVRREIGEAADQVGRGGMGQTEFGKARGVDHGSAFGKGEPSCSGGRLLSSVEACGKLGR